MRTDRWPLVALPFSAALLAGAALYGWRVVPPPALPLRLAEARGSVAEAAAARTASVSPFPGTLTSFSAETPPDSGSWPGFRGPHRDNLARDTTPLATVWPTGAPPVRWSLTLGDGHAGPAVHRGRVYLLDYDEVRGGDLLRCFALADGRELWQRFYAARAKRNHGISRTVPAVNDRTVVTLGPQCHVLAVDATDGAFRWGIELPVRFGTRVPLWYAGQCPLLDGEVAVLAPGGATLLAGVDSLSGAILWETPNPGGLAMSHSSVVVAEFDGVRQYVYGAVGGLVGVAADGTDRGRLLWTSAEFAPSVLAPTPVPLPGSRILQTAGYGGGSALFEIGRSNDTWRARVVARFDRRTFACEQQTPILRDGHLYSVLPNDAGENRQEFACLDATSGRRLWTSGPGDRFGLGPFLAAGPDLFYLLDDNAALSLVRATPSGYHLLQRAQLWRGRDAWAPMALVDGCLLLRDSTRLVCLDVRSP